jgi:LuxR family maltose regulon positive regulatory protein
METEIWDGISGRLQRFLVRLSLIDHLSSDFVALLAGKDKNLIAELEKQSAYVRLDSYNNAYLIHPLFLEFLAGKQGLLTDDEKRETYALAGDWCNRNDYKIDALTFFEKIGDYASIVSVLFALPVKMPHDIAQYAAAVFDRAPAEAFESVELLAVAHLRTCMCLGLWKKSIELAEYYEAQFLALPENNNFKNQTLRHLYFYWSFLRDLMGTIDDKYDFDRYIKKFCEYKAGPVEPDVFGLYTPGPWINGAGSARKGAPEEYIGALSRALSLFSLHCNGHTTGEDVLARGELAFYRGDIKGAEPLVNRALDQAREGREFGIMHMALFYVLRLGFAHGTFSKITKAVDKVKALLHESGYPNRFFNHDVLMGWYYCLLGLQIGRAHV